jgi:hypothetical protein
LQLLVADRPPAVSGLLDVPGESRFFKDENYERTEIHLPPLALKRRHGGGVVMIVVPRLAHGRYCQPYVVPTLIGGLVSAESE